MTAVVPVLPGERVRLVPLGPEYLPLVGRWRADPAVTRYWISDRAPSPAALDAWYRENQASGALTWAILDERSAPIGYTNLFNLDAANRRAELALMIGERAAWGRGYAKDTLRTLLGYAFAAEEGEEEGEGAGLALHKVSLTVFAENLGARRAYAACGFREDGVLRDDFFREGRWHDQIVMSVLQPEFTGRARHDGHEQGRQTE
ncbi:MAG TPA: GNAT family protein [Thermomicrobiaceae bacterium]|nr:GNAT family protein [Thermomicrobiaceae bacterium]